MRNINIKKYTLTVIGALVISCPALADTMQVKFDMNNDGAVTQNELSEGFLGNISDETFASYDLDKNGTLNAKELNTFVEINFQTIQQNHKSLIMTEQENARLKAEAAQKRAELEAMNKQSPHKMRLTMDFVVYDRNHDRLIDMDEFEARTNSEAPEIFFSKYDKNKDGYLNIEEFNNIVKSDDIVIKKSMPYEG